jgi:uncharacterized RDD family membrane protein YckC
MDLSPEGAGRPGAPRYAGFWIRVSANVLDLLWIGAVNTGVLMAVTALVQARYGPGVGAVSARISEIAVQIGALWPAIAIIWMWIAAGTTFGKWICGLRIVDEPTGGRPSAWQCIGRYFMAGIAIGLAGIGYFWIAIDPRKQGWHDKVVRTLVVHRSRAA